MDTLAHAAQAYAEGRIADSYRIARACLARAGDDRHSQAQSRWQLAQVHIVCGEVASALAQSERAAQLFESLSDREGETRSLISVAYAASQLRHNRLAFEAAQRAVRLSEAMRSPALQAAASNYLGVSLMWHGDPSAADGHLRTAMDLARGSVGSNAHVRPMVNRATGELVRLTLDRVFDDIRPDDLSALTPMVDALGSCDLAGAMPFLSAGQQLDCEAIAAWPRLFAACWRGDLPLARDCLALCSSRATSGRLAWRWVVPYVAWARHEFACITDRWPQAVHFADDMIASAESLQNRQLVWLGTALRLRALEAQGLGNEAARGWRSLIRDDMAQRRTLRRSEAWLVRHDGATNGAAAEPSRPVDARAQRERKLADWKGRYRLTKAECEVLDLLVQGSPPSAIAGMRGKTVGTVRTQLANLFDKTELRSQRAVIAAFGGAGAGTH